MQFGCMLLVLALALTSGLRAQTRSLDGHWQGAMEREGASMIVRFDFRTGAGSPSGSFTSESQRAIEYPLDKVEYPRPAIHCALGESLVFHGKVSSEAITGTFQDGPGRGTFSLKRVALAPPPYRRQDV